MSVMYIRDSSGAFVAIETIKGDPGPKGATPVKGTDYFTEADKSEIVQSVLTALPKYNGGVS